MGDEFASSDVVWAPDPYNTGGTPRPWIILTAEKIPYGGEEYICVGLTLSDLPENVAIESQDWEYGEPDGQTSFCSPWVLATIKHDAIIDPHGSVTAAFTSEIAQAAADYLTADIASQR